MASMTDDDFQAWLDAHGGEIARDDKTKEIPDPTGGIDDTGKPRRTTVVDSTIVKAKDGSTIELRRNPGPAGEAGGVPGYEVVNRNDKPASTRAEKPSSVQVEGTPDSSKPGGFDNERPVKASHWPDGRVTYEPLTPAETEEWRKSRERSRNPGGITDAEQGQAAKEAAAAAKPVIREHNGALVSVAPDGTVTTIAAAAPKEGRAVVNGVLYEKQPDNTWKPVAGTDRVTAGGVVYEKGADGQYKPVAGKTAPTRYTINGNVWEVVEGEDGKATLRKLPKEGERPLPSRWSGWQPDTAKPDAGLSDRTVEIRKAVETGDLTPEEGQTILTEAADAIKASREHEKNQEAIRQAQTQTATTERGQDVSLADQRMSSATSGFQTALQTTAEGNKYLPKGSSLGYEALMASLGVQRMHAAQMGGLATPGRTNPNQPYVGPAGPANPNQPVPPVGAPASVGQAAAPAAPAPPIVSSAPPAAMQPVAPPAAGAPPPPLPAPIFRPPPMDPGQAVVPPPPPPSPLSLTGTPSQQAGQLAQQAALSAAGGNPALMSQPMAPPTAQPPEAPPPVAPPGPPAMAPPAPEAGPPQSSLFNPTLSFNFDQQGAPMPAAVASVAPQPGGQPGAPGAPQWGAADTEDALRRAGVPESVILQARQHFFG